MAHPVLDAVRDLDEALKAVADANPTFMSTADNLVCGSAATVSTTPRPTNASPGATTA